MFEAVKKEDVKQGRWMEGEVRKARVGTGRQINQFSCKLAVVSK